MDCIKRFHIVRSIAGHDSGNLFLVLDVGAGRAQLADGKTRKTQRPKHKNLKHLELVSGCEYHQAETIGSQTISNKEIIRLLAAAAATPRNKA